MVSLESAVIASCPEIDKMIKYQSIEGMYRSRRHELYVPYIAVLKAVGFSKEDIEHNWWEHVVINGLPYILPQGVAAHIRYLERRISECGSNGPELRNEEVNGRTTE